MADRTPEERERARLEREARRAKREGRAAPAPADEQAIRDSRRDDGQRGAVAPAESRPAPAPAPVPVPEPEPAPPPATARDWRRAAGAEDPDPPNVRRVERGSGREAFETADIPAVEPARPQAPERRIPPAPTLAGEEPIGTKRVAAAGRFHRPHLPHRDRGGSGGGGGKPPRPVSDRRKWGRRIGALLALVAVAFVLWFAASLFQPFAGDGGANVTVTIPKGASVGQVGDILVAKGVVSSSFFFGLRARLEGKDGELNSGRIVMKSDMSYAAALDALTQPAKAAPKLTKLTLPEGRSRREIAQTVKQAGIPGDYVAASARSPLLDPRRYGAPKGATLEGFLFPATYQLRKNATAKDLVAQQLQAFKRNFDTVNLSRAKKKNLTPYDVLVIASMIEREAQIAKDRPLISAVIYNRLKQGMPLGIDATLRYELNNWTKPLKVSELQRDTPYNTRTRTGLPPTPIGNPGLSSIEAAAHPAKVDYLFYVVRPCGNGAHNFSSTDAQFQQDVAAYNRKRDQLGGKSPVTCK